MIENFVEVRLKSHEDFLKIKETLSRIGIASKVEKTLFQSCHILHKQKKYYIVHFKEMFLLDKKPTSITLDDIARRNTISNLLEQWDLLTIVDKRKTETPICDIRSIKIVPYKDKQNWAMVQKYTLGRKG